MEQAFCISFRVGYYYRKPAVDAAKAIVRAIGETGSRRILRCPLCQMFHIFKLHEIECVKCGSIAVPHGNGGSICLSCGFVYADH